jgi:L,D-transpeptidase ErfK/SrfK
MPLARSGGYVSTVSAMKNLTLTILALLLLTLLAPTRGSRAGDSSKTVPVYRKISGDRFAYEVADDDTARSIAARFGEPETIMPGGAVPEPGTDIELDDRHVAPAVIRDGIAINVPQRMLFVFHDGRLAHAWPATVGRPDWRTPLGRFHNASRRLDPTWHVPPAIRDEMVDEGVDPGDEVKPGPKNPLGKYFLGLDHGGIGIHGTNRPLSIFLFGSHGCIRLAPESAAKLFHDAADSESVEIIYQPVMLAVLGDGQVFLESDSDPYDQGRPHIEDVRAAARAAGAENAIDWRYASHVLAMVERESRGASTTGAQRLRTVATDAGGQRGDL